MQISAVRAQVLKQYRKARKMNDPLTAITMVGQQYAHWALTNHGLGLYRNRDAEHAAWQECQLIADEIGQRAIRPDRYGNYWMNGHLERARAVIELYCMPATPPARICTCRTAECALKHAVDHLRQHVGCWMKLVNPWTGKISPMFDASLTVHDWAELATAVQ